MSSELLCHSPSQTNLYIASKHDSAEVLEGMKVEVFSNYVIMRRFFGLLTSRELIVFRCVCRLWNELCCFLMMQPSSTHPTISLHSDSDLLAFMNTYFIGIELKTRFPIYSIFVNMWETSVDMLETFASLISPLVKTYFLQSVQLDYYGDESAQQFALKEIGKKFMILLRPTKVLDELYLKSDFEIPLSLDLLEELKSREPFSALKTLDITYLFQAIEFEENLILTFVRKTPFLKALSINLSQGYSKSFQSQFPLIFRSPQQIPIISLNITLTTHDTDMIQELIHMKCRLCNLVLLLKNPNREDPDRMMSTLTRFLENQVDSLELLGLLTFNEFAIQKIEIPILKKLRTLNLIFNAELTSPIEPFTSEQFPALEAVDLVYIFECKLFNACVFPSVKTFTLLGSECGEPWELIFPNLHKLEIFDTSTSLSLLKHCFSSMTMIEHLCIRLLPFNSIRWEVFTGQIPRCLGDSILSLAKENQSNVDPNKISIPDTGFPSLGNMTELKTLELVDASLDDIEALVFLCIIGKCPVLNELRIQQATQLEISEQYKRILSEFHQECIFLDPDPSNMMF